MVHRNGDVVIALVPYLDRPGGKERPVVVVENKGNYHFVCCCTSNDSSDKFEGILIDKDSDENQLFYNFDSTTFINFSYHLDLPSESLIYKIGNCPRLHLKRIKKHFGLVEEKIESQSMPHKEDEQD